MGDSTTETLELQCRRKNEIYAREEILGDANNYLSLHESSIPWILSHIDCFVSQSRDNRSVKHVSLYPYSVGEQDVEVWEKVGQAVGNLQALEKLDISIRNRTYAAGSDYSDDDDAEDEDSLIPDW
jgi:hypothetical protein